MTEKNTTRLSKVARDFNVGHQHIVDFLQKKGIKIESNPNAKITAEQYAMLENEFKSDISLKKESAKISMAKIKHEPKKETTTANNETEDGDEKLLTIKDSTISSDRTEKKQSTQKDQEEIVEKATKKTGEAEKQEETTEETKKSKNKKESIKEVSSEESKGKKENSLKIIGKVDIESINKKTKSVQGSRTKKEADMEEVPIAPITEQEATATKDETPPPIVEQPKEEDRIRTADGISYRKEDYIKYEVEKLEVPTILGKIELPVKEIKKKIAVIDETANNETAAKKRKRIKKGKAKIDFDQKHEENKAVSPELFLRKKKKGKGMHKPEINQIEVEKQLKDTLALMSDRMKSKSAKYRKEKREAISQRHQEEIEKREAEKTILKVTEFVSVNELASLMGVPVNDVITTCMNLGLFVSINQRIDAETISIVADEFGYKTEFTSADLQEVIVEEEDKPEDLQPRPPVVTVMGHVDHGKTKLLDHIRNTNVIAGEAGGITQHIGAYNVTLPTGQRITFLDTPGHEAFTAMRARGAQITDIAIIVVAADDGVKPQTVEAINHAQAAGVPLIFAINKIDKPDANPEKVKEELAKMNLLVEDWGGKYQSQEISAKTGLHVESLLEKVLLEAELLDLKANPNKKAVGTVVESSLDKGRGYVATILVQGGTLHVGDVVVAGTCYGRVKAMYNERNMKVEKAGPSTPALVLGIDGAPQAGERFYVMENDKEARDIANKRLQLQREQNIRVHKHITLDEIGRRLAIGNFKELNVVVKGDVDGSVEALADSIIKLSTEELVVNIIHKGVGQISETDILLAAASDALVVGFQVRPSLAAKKLAEKEEIEIRLYSIIYDAINEIKAAMEGMLSPEIKEEITANLEVLESFKVSKVGTVAGCIVRDGKITRDANVRIIRDGIVIYTGKLGSLKRFKDDVKEVSSGMECGLNIENFNDIKIGDVIESYKLIEIKKTL